MGDRIGQTGQLGWPRRWAKQAGDWLRPVSKALQKLRKRRWPGWVLWILATPFIIVWLVLFCKLFLGVLWVLDFGQDLLQTQQTGTAQPPAAAATDLRWSLLTLTALMAALGAVVTLPITLVRVQYLRRQTEATEQGLITDRINNAVEALGTEKVVKLPGKDGDGKDITVEETLPNMEARIGAIHALARIARENLNFHVQVMEILCAYIRENAPASSAVKLEMPEMPAEDVADPIKAWAYWGRKLKVALDELQSKITPRSDIQTALSVLGRRTPEQQAREAGFPNPNADGEFIFTEEFPFLPRRPTDGSATDHADWSKILDKIKAELHVRNIASNRWSGYRLDLRETNLQGYDLGQLDLSGARFDRAQMQFANMRKALMQGAHLANAQMLGVELSYARMQGTRLNKTYLQGATGLGAVEFAGARLFATDLYNTSIKQAQIDACDGIGNVKLPPGLTRPAHWPSSPPD